MVFLSRRFWGQVIGKGHVWSPFRVINESMGHFVHHFIKMVQKNCLESWNDSELIFSLLKPSILYSPPWEVRWGVETSSAQMWYDLDLSAYLPQEIKPFCAICFSPTPSPSYTNLSADCLFCSWCCISLTSVDPSPPLHPVFAIRTCSYSSTTCNSNQQYVVEMQHIPT